MRTPSYTHQFKKELLVYKLVGDEIIFERTGTHADLFE